MFANDNSATVNDIDGVKIDFPDRWVHLRKSNTEQSLGQVLGYDGCYDSGAGPHGYLGRHEEKDGLGIKLTENMLDECIIMSRQVLYVDSPCISWALLRNAP